MSGAWRLSPASFLGPRPAWHHTAPAAAGHATSSRPGRLFMSVSSGVESLLQMSLRNLFVFFSSTVPVMRRKGVCVLGMLLQGQQNRFLFSVSSLF